MPTESRPRVMLHTSMGDIVFTLFPDKAPVTTENFLQYVDDGFYDNTLIHRVVNRFIIQGGSFQPGMVQKTTRPPIHNEADNKLLNLRGALAMARLPDEPHSATSQYFVNTSDNSNLNHQGTDDESFGYCVFGEVSEGMDVVDRIEGVPTRTHGIHENVPLHEIVVETAERLRGRR